MVDGTVADAETDKSGIGTDYINDVSTINVEKNLKKTEQYQLRCY